MKHALKIENLSIREATADNITNVMRNFALDLGYSSDRIENLECRSRDGFIPHSHNMGGIECVAFRDQHTTQFEGTGFENADKTLEKYHNLDLDYFCEEDAFKDLKISKDQSAWTEDIWEKFAEYCREDDQSSVLFSCDIMLTGRNSLNIRMCVCVKDSPYHRQYDDKIEIDINFKSVRDLETKLTKLLDREDVKLFSSNLLEAY